MEEIIVKNSVDFKGSTFISLSGSVDILNSNTLDGVTTNGNIEVAVLTSFATVRGTILDDTSTNTENKAEVLIDKIIDSSFTTRDNIIKKFKNENPDLKILNNSGSLKLKDVTIIPFANPESKFNLKYLILFADEIKGLTIGEFSN